MKKIEGNIVDVVNRRIFKGAVEYDGGVITAIKPSATDSEMYIMPGLVDAHVHIESSMLIPSEFAKIAVANGTVAVVADPHEIANVLGESGIRFMVENARKAPLKVFHCVPSCVPATAFETNGSTLNANSLDNIFAHYDLKILGEMMNYPGILANDADVLAKIAVAKKHGAKIDGHAPNVGGDDLRTYVGCGIETDHECSNIDEATEKLGLGMKILIREGSSARNFEALYPLISKFNTSVMLCTDDSHPDDLVKYGHINKILKLGLRHGIDLFDMLTCACVNPVRHYNLPVGLLQVGDKADFIVVDNLTDLNIQTTVIDGNTVFSGGRTLFDSGDEQPINNFKARRIAATDIRVRPTKERIKVIEVIDKELLTRQFTAKAYVVGDNIVSDVEGDILKIVVLNRYAAAAKPSIGFISGIGLRQGAIATSVAHDSHNVIAVGCNDDDIVKAINEIVDKKGGLTYVNGNDFYTLELEFGGLMTQRNAHDVASIYNELIKVTQQNGVKLTSPFMTLSFMALLVIPELKISDKGLFDVTKFEMTSLFA